MKDFISFLQESVEVDTSNIVIRPVDNDSSVCEFEFEGQDYSVDFDKTYISGFEDDIDAVTITFFGPNGCRPTGISGSKASQLYGKLLSAVVAYVERYRPEGLNFSGVTAGMTLLYKRFADRYAHDEPGKPADKVFLRMNAYNWIRKDVYENLEPSLKASMSHHIKSWKEYEPQYYDKQRQNSIKRRQNHLKYREFFGGFVNDGRTWYLIYNVNDEGSLEVFGSHMYRDVIPEYLIRAIVPASRVNLVPKDVLVKMANVLSNPNYQEYVKLLPPGSAERIIAAAGEQ